MINTTRIRSVIFGVVKDDDSNPVPNARVSFVVGPVPLPDIAALTDIKGNFTLSAPVAGEYVISVVSDNFIAKDVKIKVELNEQKHVQMSLSRSKES